MAARTSTPTTERRARPRGPGCSVCAASAARACPTPQACEAPDLLDPAHNHPTPGEQVRGFVLVALAAAACALFLTFGALP